MTAETTEMRPSARSDRATACEHLDTVAKFFRALGDPTRLRLLDYILRGERTVSECVAHVGVSQPRVSVHLSCLVDCGYVVARRDGRRLRYRVDDPRVADLLLTAHEFAGEHAAGLEDCPVVNRAEER